MFDIWIEKARKKMFGKFEKELDESDSPDKFLNFMVRVLPKFMASVLILMGMIYIFTRLSDKYGFERIAISIGIIIILSLRGINKTLNQASE